MATFDSINAVTGFANGEKFDSPEEVFDYCTVENLHFMVGKASFRADDGGD
jgi:hypothetical protein